MPPDVRPRVSGVVEGRHWWRRGHRMSGLRWCWRWDISGWGHILRRGKRWCRTGSDRGSRGRGMVFAISVDRRCCVVDGSLVVDGRGGGGLARGSVVRVVRPGWFRSLLESSSVDKVYDVSVHKVDHILDHLSFLTPAPPYPQSQGEETYYGKSSSNGDPNLGGRADPGIGRRL